MSILASSHKCSSSRLFYCVTDPSAVRYLVKEADRKDELKLMRLAWMLQQRQYFLRERSVFSSSSTLIIVYLSLVVCQLLAQIPGLKLALALSKLAVKKE